MVQRRGAPAKEEMLPFSENLSSVDVENPISNAGADNNNNNNSTITAMSLENRYEEEEKAIRIKQWKEGPFAAAMVVPWDEAYKKFRNDGCLSYDSSETMPCLCCSAIACSKVGAGRVGNMIVLKQTTEWVEEEEIDENGEKRTRRFTRPKLQFVMGPYWPMLCCVTYPLILVVSGMTLLYRIPNCTPFVAFSWFVLTVSLIVSLALTAFRDPGILPRHETPPPGSENAWRWNDRTYSYKPPKSYFDPDTGVIVEKFDHTCPWTGTAIGKKNMGSFMLFVSLIFVCLVFNIILLTGGAK